MVNNEIRARYMVDILGKLYPFKVFAVVKQRNGKIKEQTIKIEVGGFHNKVKKSIVESNVKYSASKDGVEILKINKIEALDKHVILK